MPSLRPSAALVRPRPVLRLPVSFYIAGPMEGQPEGNATNFRRTQQWLRSHHVNGFPPRVVNPHELILAQTGAVYGSPAYADWIAAQPSIAIANAKQMLQDYRALLRCEAICFLPGWEASVGATSEVLLACHAGLLTCRANFLDGAVASVHMPPALEYPTQSFTRCVARYHAAALSARAPGLLARFLS